MTMSVSVLLIDAGVIKRKNKRKGPLPHFISPCGETLQSAYPGLAYILGSWDASQLGEEDRAIKKAAFSCSPFYIKEEIL